MNHRPDLDLTQRAWMQQHGDLTVYGSWFGPKLRPCIAILPSYKRRRGYHPVVVLIDDAWQWEPRTGSPLYVQTVVPEMAQALGMEPTPALCARIANLINDHLGDLLTMPPKPAERIAVADAIVTDQDGRETHKVITEAA